MVSMAPRYVADVPDRLVQAEPADLLAERPPMGRLDARKNQLAVERAARAERRDRFQQHVVILVRPRDGRVVHVLAAELRVGFDGSGSGCFPAVGNHGDPLRRHLVVLEDTLLGELRDGDDPLRARDRSRIAPPTNDPVKA